VPPARLVLYVASIGALGLTARSLLVRPIPVMWAAAAVVAYLLLIGAGVVFLRLQMFVDVIWRGPPGARGVALTFDDGPSPDHTPKVLDLLDGAGAKATFFVIGHKAEKYPSIVRDIVDRGHALGLHGHAHDRFFALRSPAFVRADLEREIAALERIIGDRPLIFRPPIGHSSPRIAKVVDALDLVVVGWGVRAMDGLGNARPERLAERVSSSLRDGLIVQLHDAAERSEHEPASVRALPAILEAMRERRLAGVRVDAWVDEAARAS
jgi:peptidoglycan-N-acetylglucosamine deacetylase